VSDQKIATAPAEGRRLFIDSPLTVGGGGREAGAGAGRPARNRFGFDPSKSEGASYQNGLRAVLIPVAGSPRFRRPRQSGGIAAGGKGRTAMTELQTQRATRAGGGRTDGAARQSIGSGARGAGGDRARRDPPQGIRHENRKDRRADDGETPKRDIYADVTAKIVKELEAGRFPWEQPWAIRGEAASIAAGLPRNAATGATYSGINILLLWGAAIENGFASQTWVTFKQALSLGGAVRRGERGSMVVYADKFIPKNEQERVAKEGGDAQFIPFLKRYTVFNAAQCEGVPEGLAQAAEPLPACETIERAEQLIAATGADFRIGGDKAFYVPSQDFIRVPPQPAFFEQINYYRTCFHELGHWTGHASRLNREFKGRYGSHAYAREELVAELASAFVCASLSITSTVRHADYLGSWLEVLKEDSRAIFNAASLASKAADFILAFERKNAGR
jgi:antirestriction protein ArdC